MNICKKLKSGEDFTIINFLLAIITSIIWEVWPEIGWWIIPFPLLPYLIGLFKNPGPKLSRIDFLVLLFILSSFMSSRISYDPGHAQPKLLFIVGSGFLYFSLSRLPKKSLPFISILLFATGLGFTLYFLLTHDFVNEPRRIAIINQIGIGLMNIRPRVVLNAIHPNYIAGIVTLTSIYGIYLVWSWIQKRILYTGLVALTISYVIIGTAILMTTSRGIWMALGSALGTGLIWKFCSWMKKKHSFWREIFPVIITIYLFIVMTFVYLIPAQAGSTSSEGENFGSSNRGELFKRSLLLVSDFTFTGGGLSSFPGLFSHYILSIPYYYLPNSHNIFLDVTIEQGVFGGILFLLLCMVSVWIVAAVLTKELPNSLRLFGWLTLLATVTAIVHGMVDNYLYNEKGAIFSLLFVGLAVFIKNNANQYLWTKSSFHYLEKVRFRYITYLALGLGFLLVIFAGINLGQKIFSAIYANLGAVQMSYADLEGFPQNSWREDFDDSLYLPAEVNFQRSIEYNPMNRTANHRLGLISIQRMKYQSAINYLELANQVEPRHRGVVKSLGYCYVWLGDYEKAQKMLVQIPESENELEVYTWWWKVQGYTGLSEKSAEMAAYLHSR